MARESKSPPSCVLEYVDGVAVAPEHFFAAFEQKSRPAVLTGLTREWSAMKNWSLDALVRQYGDKKFDIGSSSHKYMTLSAYANYMRTTSDEAPRYLACFLRKLRALMYRASCHATGIYLSQNLASVAQGY